MSLTNINRKVIHNGNASATSFAFTFPILDASHLSVIYTNASGVETTLSSSLYSVTGIGSLTGGSVTYPLTGSPIASGTKLTIVRTVPYTQTTVLSNQGGYYPEVVEQRFDLMYMALQQLAEIVSRYTVSSISDPATEQSNYALIQALQTFQTGIDKLTAAGDLLTHNGSAYLRLARGSAGQVLGLSGTAVAWITPSVKLTVWTGSATWTVDTNMRQALLGSLGGGGGGGGAASAAATIGGGGGGGGAGGFSLKLTDKATAGTSQSVTIGAAGTAASAGNNAGGAGGDTSIGTICIAKGATGGRGWSGSAGSAGNGGAGGIAGTGDIAATGATGESIGTFTSGIPCGGTGASSPFGGGGKGSQASSAGAGAAGTGYGAGGGAGNSYNGGGTAAGAAGTAGLAFALEIVRP